MVTLIDQVHFYTLKDDIVLKENDTGCFKIYSKGATISPSEAGRYLEEKQSYVEGRGLTCIPKNNRPHKLRDTIKELEDILASQRCVSVNWNSPYPLQIFFNSGIIASLPVKDDVFEIESIMIDRFLVGKLLSEHVVDVILEDTFMVISYVEPKITYVYFGKNSSMFNPGKSNAVSKLANLDPKITTLDVIGGSGRRLERKLSLSLLKDLILVYHLTRVNKLKLHQGLMKKHVAQHCKPTVVTKNFMKVLVWWSDSTEVRPWMPLTMERDRATAVVYALGHQSCEIMCYGRIEPDPLSAIFSRYQPDHILTVEERTTNGTDIGVGICVYEASRGRFHRISETVVPLQGHVVTLEWNEMEDKLLLACDDCSLVMYDSFRQVTQQVMAQIPPVEIAWHPSGTVVFLASEIGQIQCFDSALSSIDLQLLSEECNSSKVLELTPYFRQQPSLWRLIWKGKDSSLSNNGYYSQSARAMLCLLFERGPLVFLSFSLGVQTSCGTLGHVELITQYLKQGKIDEAVCLLLSIDWSRQAEICYQGLSKVVNFLLRKPLDIDREAQLEAALGSFYAPAATIPEIVFTKYSEHVRHLARRFFFHLLRYHRFEKAFLLAVDLECQDLFMNLHYAALQKGEMKLAAVSLQHVERLERGSEVTTTTEDESAEDEEELTEFTEEDDDDDESEEEEEAFPNHSSNAPPQNMLFMHPRRQPTQQPFFTDAQATSASIHQAVVQPIRTSTSLPKPLIPTPAAPPPGGAGMARSYKWPTNHSSQRELRTAQVIETPSNKQFQTSSGNNNEKPQTSSTVSSFAQRTQALPKVPPSQIPPKIPPRDIHITIEPSEPEVESRHDSPPPPPLPPRMPRRPPPPQPQRTSDISLISWTNGVQNPTGNTVPHQMDSKSASESSKHQEQDPTEEDVESARVKFIHFGVV